MIKFFILAGGIGTRAQPLSDIKPKILFPLNGIPLFDHMLNNIYRTGVKEGFINVFHLADQIEKEVKGKTGLSIIPEKKLSGNLILKTALDARDKPDLLLIVNGDVFTSIPLKEMYQRLQLKKAYGVILT